jgi:steroid delta-isomerase-like uncharacterized protein
MSAQENAKIAKAAYQAFNSREIEQWAAEHVMANTEWVNVPMGTIFRGSTGFNQYIQSWLMAFPDAKIEIINMVADEETVATEFRGRGRHTGPLMGLAGEIPATGKAIDMAFCEVMRFKNGKTTSTHLYFDAATMMRQLGLMG